MEYRSHRRVLGNLDEIPEPYMDIIKFSVKFILMLFIIAFIFFLMYLSGKASGEVTYRRDKYCAERGMYFDRFSEACKPGAAVPMRF